MFGRMMNETLGKIHFWCSFVGTYAIFMPFHYLGMAGNVRRYQAFVVDYMQPLIPVHRFITVAALFTGAAQLIFLYNLIYSRFKGEPATENPWQATSLEWSTPTTPPPPSTGIWVVLASIAMSFAAFTSALIVRQGSAADWRHLTLPGILYLNTVVLLASSIALEVARRRVGAFMGGRSTQVTNPARW